MKQSTKQKLQLLNFQMVTGALMLVIGLVWYLTGDFAPDKPTSIEKEKRQMELSEDYLYATTNKQRNTATRQMQLEDQGVRVGRSNVWRGKENAPFLRALALTISGIGAIIFFSSLVNYLRFRYKVRTA